MQDDVGNERSAGPARSTPGNLGYLFRLGHQAFRGALERALEPHGLSVAQYGALSAFAAQPRMSSAELARRAAVTPQTMNAVVHQLAERDLLEQRPHPTHRKVIVLCLSPQGRALLDRATPAVRAVERAAVRDLPAAHARVVTDWLAAVIVEFGPDRTAR